MSPAAWTAFAVAGAAGACGRYVLDGYIADRTDGVFPWGTFLINASGSLLLGLLTGLGLYHGLATSTRLILGTGFCGAFTTFSTFTFETVRLAEEGAAREAVRNAVGTLVTCAGAAAIGLAMTAW